MAQQHLDRLTAVDASFLAPGGHRSSHMHVGGVLIFDGAPPAFERRPRQHPRPAAPRSALPPEAGDAAAGDRPSAVGRRSRTSTSSSTSATRRCRRPAARSSCWRSRLGSPPSRWTAPSRCGSCGWSRACAADGRGQRALRARLQDPPFARRRRLRGRPRDGALRSRARSAGACTTAPSSSPGARSLSRPRRSWRWPASATRW